MQPVGAEVSGFIGIFLIQITILILYGIFVRYDIEMLPIDSKIENITSADLAKIQQSHRVSYPREY